MFLRQFVLFIILIKLSAMHIYIYHNVAKNRNTLMFSNFSNENTLHEKSIYCNKS